MNIQGSFARAMAVAFLIAGTPVTGWAESHDGNTGGYLELGGTYDRPYDYTTDYRGEGGTEYDLDNARGGKLQAGYDFGKIRLDVKLTATTGDIDNVGDRTAKSDSNFWYGTATLNLYWDIYRFALGDQGGLFKFGLTPFVGVGVGGGVVHLDAGKTDDPVTSSGDKKTKGGPGGRGSVGLLIDITESVGLTVGYDYQYFYTGKGNKGLSNQSAEAGLRFTF